MTSTNDTNSPNGEATDPDGARVMKRGDLTATAVMSGAVAALATVFGLGGLIVRAFGDEPVMVTADVGKGLSVGTAPPGFTAEAVRGTVGTSGANLAVLSVAEGLQLLAVITIAVVLCHMAVSALRGEPFGGRVVRSLNIAAGASIVGLVGAVVAGMADISIKTDAGLEPSTIFSFAWIGVGAVLAAFASIWRHGLAMRDELELTV